MGRHKFTHFFSLPFNLAPVPEAVNTLMFEIKKRVSQHIEADFVLIPTPPIRSHVTLAMLPLEDSLRAEKVVDLVKEHQKEVQEMLAEIGEFTFKGIGHFGVRKSMDPYEGIRVIYLQPELSPETELKVRRLNDFIVTRAIKEGIIPEQTLNQMHVKYDQSTKLMSAQNYHMTLFRVNRQYSRKVDWSFLEDFSEYRVQARVTALHVSTIGSYEPDGFYAALAKAELNSE